MIYSLDTNTCIRYINGRSLAIRHKLPTIPDAVILDGASAHRGKAMGEVGFERIYLLPYSPELNPCERVLSG